MGCTTATCRSCPHVGLMPACYHPCVPSLSSALDMKDRMAAHGMKLHLADEDMAWQQEMTAGLQELEGQ